MWTSLGRGSRGRGVTLRVKVGVGVPVPEPDSFARSNLVPCDPVGSGPPARSTRTLYTDNRRPSDTGSEVDRTRDRGPGPGVPVWDSECRSQGSSGL